MPDNILYEYAIVRIVPKVEREEFFNVGVIVYARTKRFLKLKFHIDAAKLAVFSDELTVDFFEDYLQAWHWVCEGDQQGGRIGELDLAVRFRWLTAQRSTVIQSSRPHVGLCSDLDELVEKLFKEYA